MQKTVGLYIHIPFCQKMCHYCSFLTFVNREDTIDEYIHYLMKEIALYHDKHYKVDTIYFGGGTPSFIPEIYITQILACIHKHFDVLDDCEISIEMNPESVTEAKLESYLAAGINRYSMGVQSFNNDVLKLMGRLHTKERVFENIDLMARLGIKKFGIDLMFANPKQSMAVLEEDLAIASSLPINHISYYSLMIKDNTPFKRWVETGQIKLVSDEEERAMYYQIQQTLTNHGFEQYEISNFAKDGAQSRHNKKYWQLEDYIGLGLDASSNIGLERFDNQRSFAKYFAMIDEGQLPIEFKEQMTGEEREHEYIMLQLRLLKGFEIADINARFKIDFLKKYQAVIEKHTQYGTVELVDGTFRFTQKGLDIGNQLYLDII